MASAFLVYRGSRQTRALAASIVAFMFTMLAAYTGGLFGGLVALESYPAYPDQSPGEATTCLSWQVIAPADGRPYCACKGRGCHEPNEAVATHHAQEESVSVCGVDPAETAALVAAPRPHRGGQHRRQQKPRQAEDAPLLFDAEAGGLDPRTHLRHGRPVERLANQARAGVHDIAH